jgi:cytochrome c oxidase subunit II
VSGGVDLTTTGAADPSIPDQRPQRPRSRRWAIGAALITAVLLAGCKVPSFGAYRGSTTQAQTTFKLWQLFFIAGLVVGGLVFVLILFAIVRYRRRASDTLPKQSQYHTLVEIAYTIVPVVIVLVLFGFTVVAENKVTAVSPNPAVRIKVVAFQWGWEFDYPYDHVKPVIGAANIIDGTAVNVPQMVVPTGETVQIHLVSRDVIHGFYVPQFNFSRYAQPGFNNYFDLNVVHTGVFRGQCTQLCGLYHSVMLFSVKAVTPAQFQAWISHRQSTSSSSSGGAAT